MPTEPAGKYAQPNPYWGLGFKPDGTQYKFSVLCSNQGQEFWLVITKVPESQLTRSGADVDFYDAAAEVDRQISQMDDIIQKGTDGIVIYAVDSRGLVPAVDRAGDAGIPVFTMDVPVLSDAVTSHAGRDNYANGVFCAEWMEGEAKRLDKELVIFEQWCPMFLEVCSLRSEGFMDYVENSDWLSVFYQNDNVPPGSQESVMNGIMDVLPSHPECNAIYADGGFSEGVTQGLEAIDRLYPIGDPNHVVFTLQDGYPLTYEIWREHHSIDMLCANSPYVQGDLIAKAALTYVCLGETVPDYMEVPIEGVTDDNLEMSKWGPRWGILKAGESDFDKWPILDIAEVIATPTYK